MEPSFRYGEGAESITHRKMEPYLRALQYQALGSGFKGDFFRRVADHIGVIPVYGRRGRIVWPGVRAATVTKRRTMMQT